MNYSISVAIVGLTAKLSSLLTAELGLRAYYERAPKEAGADDPGYDQWSLRQDTLLGLTYVW